MEIEKMMVAALEKIKTDGLIEKTIQETMEKTVKSIINDLFRDWSDFGKDLKEKLSVAVKVNLENINLPEYNVMIENYIKQSMTATMNENHKKLVEDQLSAILRIEEKQEWKLSEIIEKIREDNTDEDEPESEQGQMTLIFDNWYSDMWHIYIDAEPDVSKYKCHFQFHIDSEKLTDVKLGDVDLGKDVPYRLYNVDALMFRLYTQGIKIEIDQEESEEMINYPNQHDH